MSNVANAKRCNINSGFKPAAKKKSCDINYSKWDALEDSDADDDAATEGGSSGGAARAAEGQPVGGAEGVRHGACSGSDRAGGVPQGIWRGPWGALTCGWSLSLPHSLRHSSIAHL
ncbi:unnamed protein product [Prorocentrum cordatum]|uniref:Uncharacterized protein n=1 Tax=Prorocentrum cordatum TaxID=2364126 RepID=A0ABN9UJW5_9DINO|nr:unnamed protein product [Polarella glacialis]